MVSTDRAVAPVVPSLFVGTPLLRGDIGRYAKRFDLLEMSAEPGRHPKRAGLVALRRAVPPEFVFSVVPPIALSALEAGSKTDELIAAAESVADALGAAWWVLRTPPSVTPSARATRALEALVARLRAGQRRIAWEPRGVWRDDEALRVARSLGVNLVRDLLMEDPPEDDEVVYTRIRALGEGARVGMGAAERIAERLAGVTTAYVVVEGTGAAGVRKVLREALSIRGDESDEEQDDEDEGFEGDPDEPGEDEEEEAFE